MTEPRRAPDGGAMPLRLDWRALNHASTDFEAHAGGFDGPVGRVYRRDDGTWFWSLVAGGSEVSRNIGRTSGSEATSLRAARQFELAWSAAIKGSSLDRLALGRNALPSEKVRGK